MVKFTSIETTINNLSNCLKAANTPVINFCLNRPDTNASIYADSEKICQAVVDICTYASQKLAKIDGALEIFIDTLALDGSNLRDNENGHAVYYLKVSISATGPKINPSDVEQLFNLPAKTDVKEEDIRLVEAHRIIKNDGGSIIVEGQSGKRVTFTILFPAVTDKPSSNDKASNNPFPGNKTIFGNETILVVDDEQSILDISKKMLGRLGYTVETRCNPVEALALFKSRSDDFNLIMTDMAMPQMSGLELIEKLKAVRSDIPIIICTGYSPLIDETKVKALGVAAYVIKPIMWRDVAKTIREVLEYTDH